MSEYNTRYPISLRIHQRDTSHPHSKKFRIELKSKNGNPVPKLSEDLYHVTLKRPINIHFFNREVKVKPKGDIYMSLRYSQEEYRQVPLQKCETCKSKEHVTSARCYFHYETNCPCSFIRRQFPQPLFILRANDIITPRLDRTGHYVWRIKHSLRTQKDPQMVFPECTSDHKDLHPGTPDNNLSKNWLLTFWGAVQGQLQLRVIETPRTLAQGEGPKILPNPRSSRQPLGMYLTIDLIKMRESHEKALKEIKEEITLRAKEALSPNCNKDEYLDSE